MRTQEEIIARIEEKKSNCLFPWELEDLVFALTFENAQKFLKEDHTLTEEEWKQYKEADIISGIKDYVPFAFEKVVDHRGISASRSVSRFRTWVWLLENDELLAFIDDELNYMQYGAPIVKRVAEEYGVSLPSNELFDAMANGEICSACRVGHQSGCGK